MEAIRFRGVEKSFGDVRAVKSIDLDIPEGGIFGLLGPNGAGKSTLIRMTLGILLPDAGDIEVLGGTRTLAERGLFGYLPEERGLYPKMKVGELLRFFGRLRGLSGKDASEKASEGLERVGLEEVIKSNVDELSKGMQQKIQLLVAIQHHPRIAILDEPFSGLDPVNVELFQEIVRETVAAGTTVILSTHQMEQVERLCDTIALINQGDVVLRGDVTGIRREYGRREVRVRFSSTETPRENGLDELVEDLRAEGRDVRYRMREGITSGQILERLLGAGAEISRFEEAQASMHDIFVRVVSEGGER